MTREMALEGLSSDVAHDRLKAVRFLARNGDASDLQVLRNALQTETVSYVRAGLKLAIKRASATVSSIETETVEEYEVPADVREQIKNEITEQITGQILHEIASPVGLIAAAAAREVRDYEHSKTKRHVENLKRVFGAIEQLKGATAVPKPEEFDLAELLVEIVSTCAEDAPDEVSMYGPKPMLITSDRTLVRLAVSNGIRNAVEAVLGSAHGEPHPIVVTWGATDIDYWTAILDRGPGVVGLAESAFGIGKTTKRGHSGFGLTIARKAIETLGGSCTLQPATEGGTRFEVRWER